MKKAHEDAMQKMISGKDSLFSKFEEETRKLYATLSRENARMREVMMQQWQEMKGLRQQNAELAKDFQGLQEQISTDVRSLRSLIITSREEGSLRGSPGESGLMQSPSKSTAMPTPRLPPIVQHHDRGFLGNKMLPGHTRPTNPHLKKK